VTSVGEATVGWRCLLAQLDGRFSEAEHWAREGVQIGARFRYSRERSTAMYGLQTWWLQIARGRAASIVPAWVGS